MDINEVYVRLNNEEPFTFKEESSIDFDCPECKKHLVNFSLVNGKREYESPQECLYDDGDTIDVPQKYWLKADTEMMFGVCNNCKNKIALINTVVLDRDIDKADIDEDLKGCFMVYSEDDVIKDFEDVKQYAIKLNDISIGKVIVYKKATLNKSAFHGLLKDINRNIALASLECLAQRENMNILNLGICNGHFKNEEQWEIWKEASSISEDLINAIAELL